MSVVPVFVFSLPRSGSTLVQRVLTAHAGVASSAEPWVLLPLLTPLEPDVVMSGPWDRTVASAIGDFTAGLPAGATSYRARVRELALELYADVAGPSNRFFVDKSPPYHLIVEEVIATFPDARFVFLWRNPLSVLASVVDTLADGRWCTYRFRGDLFHGIDNLVAAYDRHRDRAHAVRYEDLLSGVTAWRVLCEYIGMDFDPEALSRFAEVRFDGRMGDPTGVEQYQALSAEPLERWKKTLSNPVRREWSRRWLHWIGRERLDLMGYDLSRLVADLETVPMSREGVLADAGELVLAAARETVKHWLPGDHLLSTTQALLGPKNGPPLSESL
jgi:hypothetical protein